MRRRRILLLLTLIACGSSECRLDPSPSCSYRPERATGTDGGVDMLADEIASVRAGDVHACAFLSTGEDVFGGEERRPRCWGGNPNAQLARVASPEPGELWWYVDWDDEIAFLDLGAAHGCVVDLDDPGDPAEITCWGNNEGGQLGQGRDEEIRGLVITELEPSEGDGRITSFAAGGLHSCIADGTLVACMGDDRWNQLGRLEEDCCQLDFTEGGEWLTRQPYDRIDLDAGTRHTCALLRETDGSAGSLFCWGDHGFGQLGPRGVADMRGAFFHIADDVRDFATGPHHGCLVDAEGTVRCWGRNERGELGAGDATRPEPEPVPLPMEATRIFAGGESGLAFGGDLAVVTPGAAHSCALGESGEAFCWGDNSAGQLGAPAGEPREPIATHPDLRFRDLALGGRFTCGVTLDEELYCWGDNGRGQLGRVGESSHEPSPVPIFDESGAALGE